LMGHTMLEALHLEGEPSAIDWSDLGFHVPTEVTLIPSPRGSILI